MSTKFLFLILLCPAFIPTVHGQVDSWSNNGSGTFKWEDASNWSLGVSPFLGQSSTLITNNVSSFSHTRTVSIDADTANNALGTMTISNLTLSIPSALNRTVLFLNNTGATALDIVDSLAISNRCTVSITNSALIVGTSIGTLSVDGTLLLNTGTLICSGSSGDGDDNVIVGNTGVGQMTVLDGMWQVDGVTVGNAPGSQGTLTLAGGTTVIRNNFVVGFQSGATGAVWLTGGQLINTNGDSDVAEVGGVGVGQMTVSNATWVVGELDVGGSQGTLTVAGGTITVPDMKLYYGNGTVWMTSGQLTVDGFMLIGGDGASQITVSNGTLQTGYVLVGDEGSGTLTVAGGTNTLSSFLSIGEDSGSTGAVWLTGGLLTTLNDATYVGQSDVGAFTMTGGNWLASEVEIGELAGAQGTLTMSGGQMVVTNGTGQIVVGGAGLGRMAIAGGSILAQTVCIGCATGGPIAALTMTGGSLTVLGSLVVGDCAADDFAFVQVSGGSTVYVTNAAHNAVLDVRSGSFLLDGGTLVVDILVATNECDATFDHIGGTLTVGTLVLDPNGDIDGDGLPNGWEQAHGLDPLSSIGDNGADGDPDGDGYSNYQEYLAGSDPQNPLSTPLQIVAPLFQITSIVQSGNNIVLTWNTASGLTNQVEVTSGGTGGSYSTTSFTSLGPQLLMGGSGLITTNYTDTGGATNKPARYYRVRLVP